MSKLLQTVGRLKKTAPPSLKSGGFVSTNQVKDGRLNLSVREYCMRYGRDEDFLEVQKKIISRRSLIPAFTFWKCPACGWRGRNDGEAPERAKENPILCLRCNLQRHEDSKGWLVEMDEKEVAQFLKDEEAEAKRFSERLMKSNLFGINLKRQEEGLSPLTMEQYRANEKREWERMREMERSSKPKYYNQDAIEAEKKAEQEGVVTK